LNRYLKRLPGFFYLLTAFSILSLSTALAVEEATQRLNLPLNLHLKIDLTFLDPGMMGPMAPRISQKDGRIAVNLSTSAENGANHK